MVCSKGTPTHTSREIIAPRSFSHVNSSQPSPSACRSHVKCSGTRVSHPPAPVVQRSCFKRSHTTVSGVEFAGLRGPSTAAPFLHPHASHDIAQGGSARTVEREVPAQPFEEPHQEKKEKPKRQRKLPSSTSCLLELLRCWQTLHLL